MVFLDVNDTTGVQLLHKFIRGENPDSPSYYTFGSITDTGSINDQLGSIPNEFVRIEVDWSQTGSNSKYEVNLSTAECNGSYINIEGLVSTSSLGAGSTYTVDESVVFNKNEGFFVVVEGEVVVRN